MSDRRRWDGGGSRGVGVEGIERKWRDGEEVARQMYLCVGDTEIDHNGGEGIGYVDWILVFPLPRNLGSLTKILPVNRHLSTRSVESDPAVNNLKSSSLGTLYPLVWKLSGSLMTRAMRDTLG